MVPHLAAVLSMPAFFAWPPAESETRMLVLVVTFGTEEPVRICKNHAK